MFSPFSQMRPREARGVSVLREHGAGRAEMGGELRLSADLRVWDCAVFSGQRAGPRRAAE